jgi:hypothetical protein
MKRTLLLLSLIAGLLAVSSAANGQVLVYKLFFHTTGDTINYEFYNGGYFVVESPRGTGTFVLTLDEHGEKLYDSSGSGEMFFIRKDERSNRMIAVLRAEGAGSGSSAQAYFQATGKVGGGVRLGGGFAAPVSESLEGFMVASGSGEPIADGDSGNDTEAPGFAGQARMKASLDDGLTQEFNANFLDVSAAVAALETHLEQDGFEQVVTTTSGGGGGDNGSTDP